ncbi:MAG: DUF948 domain-containing protein [Bacillota bacterium]|nr:DUF948 domain-containing protein [Bacillota bacterium]
MKIILYLSIALIAIAFLVLVIYLSKALKSLQSTLDNVSKTLVGVEKQLEGVTSETTSLLQKTNELADDLKRKSDGLNTIVDAIRDVGITVSKFNKSIRNITDSVDIQVEESKEKISQIVQWSNVFLEFREKWKERKLKEKGSKNESEPKKRQFVRSR